MKGDLLQTLYPAFKIIQSTCKIHQAVVLMQLSAFQICVLVQVDVAVIKLCSELLLGNRSNMNVCERVSVFVPQPGLTQHAVLAWWFSFYWMTCNSSKITQYAIQKLHYLPGIYTQVYFEFAPTPQNTMLCCLLLKPGPKSAGTLGRIPVVLIRGWIKRVTLKY